MNHILKTTLAAALMLLTFVKSFTQPRDVGNNLQLTFNKTTSIVFPYAIASVDRGSRDILAQKAKGVENVLQLKAARPDFPESNLTVITIDGQLYTFTINYSKHPLYTVLTVSHNTEKRTGRLPGRPLLIMQMKHNGVELHTKAAKVVHAKRSVHFKARQRYKVTLSLDGIYVDDDIIFYRLNITNLSQINYDVESLRFYIRDKQKVKRTATQEVELNPLYLYGDRKMIKGNTSKTLVYVLPKFTIPDAKGLVIEMMEKNGGRNIDLKVTNRSIVKARAVPK